MSSKLHHFPSPLTQAVSSSILYHFLTLDSSLTEDRKTAIRDNLKLHERVPELFQTPKEIRYAICFLS